MEIYKNKKTEDLSHLRFRERIVKNTAYSFTISSLLKHCNTQSFFERIFMYKEGQKILETVNLTIEGNITVNENKKPNDPQNRWVREKTIVKTINTIVKKRLSYHKISSLYLLSKNIAIHNLFFRRFYANFKK